MIGRGMTRERKSMCAFRCSIARVRARVLAAAPLAHSQPAAAADRDHQGRRHRQRLYLSLSGPSVDVHRHACGRDRHRPDRPEAAGDPYIDEIKAVTKAPIKYVIYSHSHFDHIAGGKPFKDLGASFIATRTPRRGPQLKPDAL